MVRTRCEATQIPTRSPEEQTERGAVLFIMFIFLAIFLGVAALAVDLAAIATRGQTLQNTADASALAAVVEYEQQLVDGASEADARAAAIAVANEVIAQNGIDPSSGTITVGVEFPPGGGRVRVTIGDEDPPSFLGNSVVPGFDASVDRGATAEFLGCEDCSVEVAIPRPFTAVDAEGEGDGYKPIRVGSRLYALNHNSGNRQIVCVDILTQAPCWDDAFGDPDVTRDAYFSFGDRNPEMPHTGVVGTRIFWSVSDVNVGHRLFCFETATDSPCSTSWQMGDDLRIDEDDSPLTSDKDENRGGGTVEVDDKIYVFTDNHEIHCFDALLDSYCGAFLGAGSQFRDYGGRPTALDIFPDNNPLDGNHGSSIDRIVNDNNGFIYSTIHIPFAVDSLKCADSFAVTEDTAENLIDEIVVIRAAGQYLSAAGDDNLTMINLSGDFTDQSVRWRVTRDAPDSSVYLEAVGLSNEGSSPEQWLDGESDDTLLPSPLGTDLARTELDNEWNLTFDAGGFLIESDATPSYINRTPLGGVVQELNPDTRWTIQRCVDPAVDAGYAAGTWLHCYDTRTPGPCAGFTPSAIHDDGSRFSGRLFFSYDPAPLGGGQANKRAACSSGYDAGGNIEIKCVDLDDGDPNAIGSAMSALASDIQGSTGSSPGAWGDPHYNAFTNRLFYPTEHNTSKIFCWDFDSGIGCGEYIGETRPAGGGPGDLTEDYGFISIDDCVFGLGHEAFFWAFQATDIGEPCVGARSSTVLEPCPCTGAEERWGILDFRDLDLTDYDVFNVAITTNPDDPEVPGIQIGEVRELKPLAPELRIIKVDEMGIPDDLDSVRVVIYVEALNDPFEYTSPTFEIRFPQRPRLID